MAEDANYCIHCKEHFYGHHINCAHGHRVDLLAAAKAHIDTQYAAYMAKSDEERTAYIRDRLAPREALDPTEAWMANPRRAEMQAASSAHVTRKLASVMKNARIEMDALSRSTLAHLRTLVADDAALARAALEPDRYPDGDKVVFDIGGKFFPESREFINKTWPGTVFAHLMNSVGPAANGEGWGSDVRAGRTIFIDRSARFGKMVMAYLHATPLPLAELLSRGLRDMLQAEFSFYGIVGRKMICVGVHVRSWAVTRPGCLVVCADDTVILQAKDAEDEDTLLRLQVENAIPLSNIPPLALANVSALARTDDGQLVCISSCDNQVAILAPDGTLTRSLPVGDVLRPEHVAISPSNDIYLYNTDPTNVPVVQVWDLQGNCVLTRPWIHTFVLGLAVAPSSNSLYVLYQRHFIKYQRDTLTNQGGHVFPRGVDPCAIVINQNDEVFVADCKGQQIIVYSDSGQELRRFPLQPLPQVYPSSKIHLALTASGDGLLVSREGYNTVEFYM